MISSNSMVTPLPAGALPPLAVGTPGTVPLGAPPLGTGESCPPPLVWQSVLTTFFEQSTPWEVLRGASSATPAVRLRGRSWGEGPDLFLLNSFTGHSELLSLMAYLLKDQFRCHLFDWEVLDRRRTRQQYARIDDFAGDLSVIADQLGLTQFAVYGADFGAAVALQAALREPQRLTHLIVQAGCLRRRLSWAERLLVMYGLRSSRKWAEFRWRDRIQWMNHRRWFPPLDPSRFEFFREVTGERTLFELAVRASALDHFDLRQQATQIQQPLLAISTEGAGQVAKDAQRELLKLVPHGREEHLHTTGQLTYLTHPHRLAKLFRRDLLGEEPSSSCGTGIPVSTTSSTTPNSAPANGENEAR